MKLADDIQNAEKTLKFVAENIKEQNKKITYEKKLLPVVLDTDIEKLEESLSLATVTLRTLKLNKKEVNRLLEQKTKIMLMFNPNGTPDEKNIVAKLDYIHQKLSFGERTFMPRGNGLAIDDAIIALQPLVQDMLKIEWNRVRRVKN